MKSLSQVTSHLPCRHPLIGCAGLGYGSKEPRTSQHAELRRWGTLNVERSHSSSNRFNQFGSSYRSSGNYEIAEKSSHVHALATTVFIEEMPVPPVASSMAKIITPCSQGRRFISKLKIDVLESTAASMLRLRNIYNGMILDSLLLSYSSLVIPYFSDWLKVPSISCFVGAGMLLGPHGFNVVSNHEFVDKLGELAILLFVVETAMEVSRERLYSLKKNLLGIGAPQLLLTTIVGAAVTRFIGSLDWLTSSVVGLGLSFSGSAIVMELLRSRGQAEFATAHGNAAAGLILLQDLCLIPVLIFVDVVARGSGSHNLYSFMLPVCKAAICSVILIFLGQTFISPLLSSRDVSNVKGAFTSAVLSTVISMSYFTKGMGLPDSLGSFLAGMIFSQSKNKHQIEADVATFRGVFMNIFYMAVGFHIDCTLILSRPVLVATLLAGLLLGKAAVTTMISMTNGVPTRNAVHAGLLTSQCSEFAFVSFAAAGKTYIFR
jgi:Kef-type K+ transport system membrane component KefB